ncbi:pimeloyl-ACP methyl ester carboxylesterase [Peribacillus deserti]|uniref:Pimeloyl-ACP methyl ester carboxylesterase n=1 Tax=Peribacillus deserti TaxID=673318 RepID=A0ABS2QHW8_9BACI|nr:alpha/beta hydrolase [Peribacillus deserti]MBM7692108.1 pimeloyl-ACP methyl ester carboxylesterase [Peribacillus deserti]
MNTKKKIRFWVITRNVFLFIVAVVLIWFVFHHSMTAYEQKKYPPLGQLVEVDGKKMHVYTKGDGENTIVLLSGLGTAAPVLDFEPLINELAKNNKVVIVESFGYGWSDITKKERTVENIVEEIRTALKAANIEAPYILMPHSISGIYSLYYANTYPDEVKAVIGIDFTLPQALEYFGESAPTMPEYLSYVAPTGIARLALYMIPDNFLPIAEKGTYSVENLNLTKAISGWKGYNKNIVDEANEIKNNVQKTVDLTFPADMPVLIFTPEKDKLNEDGKSKLTFYHTQLNNRSSSKITTLKGHHYLHWTRYKEMSKQVNEFIETFAWEKE